MAEADARVSDRGLRDAARVLRWRLRGRAAAQGPRCRRCGYPARGSDAAACPECGADWAGGGLADPERAVGAVRVLGRRVVHTAGPAVGWAVILILSMVSFYIFLVPRVVSGAAYLNLTLDSEIERSSVRIHGVHITATTDSTRDWPGGGTPWTPVDHVQVQLSAVWQANAATGFRGRHVEVDPSTMTARAGWRSKVNKFDFRRPVGVEAWLQEDYGLSPDDEQVRRLAILIHTAVRAAIREGVVLDERHPLRWPDGLEEQAASAGGRLHAWRVGSNGIDTYENDDLLTLNIVGFTLLAVWIGIVITAWRRTRPQS